MVEKVHARARVVGPTAGASGVEKRHRTAEHAGSGGGRGGSGGGRGGGSGARCGERRGVCPRRKRTVDKVDGVVGGVALAVGRHQQHDRRQLLAQLRHLVLLEVDRLGLVAAPPCLAHELVGEALGGAGLRAPQYEKRTARELARRALLAARRDSILLRLWSAAAARAQQQ